MSSVLNRGKVIMYFVSKKHPKTTALEYNIYQAINGMFDIMVVAIDADCNPELLAKYNTTKLPTMFLVQDGFERHRQIGLITPIGIRKLIDERFDKSIMEEEN